MIPKTSPKPEDGRTRKCKAGGKPAYFRFPLLINREEKDFYPVLSGDEKLLRGAELDYYACEFETAQAAFEDLLRNTQSIYIEIMALYYLCSLSVWVYGGKDFKIHYSRLLLALAGDFPYKKEMEIVLPLLYTTLVQYRMTAESFTFDISYDYSESVLPLMAYLSVFHFPDLFQSRAKPVSLDSFELLCRQIARDNAYYEECELHFMLFTAYYFTLRDDMMLYHLRKGMDIAIERGIALLPSGYMAYYSDVFQKIAGEYPDEYMNRIRCKSKIFTDSYDKFTDNNDIEKLYSRISANDYRFVLFAANGLTNKQVGDICKLSERSVAKMYNDICAKLGFDGKRQLLTELRLSAGKKK